MDIPGSLINALVRGGPGLPVRLKPEDIEIHRTRNSPKCATVVLVDMSGSMRYDGQYIHVKRMGLAFDGLIRREYPGDCCNSSRCTPSPSRGAGEIVALMPKPVTIFDPVVRLRADMSGRGHQRDAHSRRTSPTSSTPCNWAGNCWRPRTRRTGRSILITDGLPTAHFEGQHLYLLYPPDRGPKRPRCGRGGYATAKGSRSTSSCCQAGRNRSEDVQFAHRLAESTAGRVFFTAGRELDRYVVWDYVRRRREIVA